MLAIPLCEALVPPPFAPRTVIWAPVGHSSPLHLRSTAEVRRKGQTLLNLNRIPLSGLFHHLKDTGHSFHRP
jgi:hypothetical protein